MHGAGWRDVTPTQHLLQQVANVTERSSFVHAFDRHLQPHDGRPVPYAPFPVRRAPPGRNAPHLLHTTSAPSTTSTPICRTRREPPVQPSRRRRAQDVVGLVARTAPTLAFTATLAPDCHLDAPQSKPRSIYDAPRQRARCGDLLAVLHLRVRAPDRADDATGPQRGLLHRADHGPGTEVWERLVGLSQPCVGSNNL